MERFLARTFTIADHPVRTMPPALRLRYVNGIGEFLCFLTRDDRTARLVFEIWCMSVAGHVPAGAWSFTYDFTAFKGVFSTDSDSEDSITMRRSFLFDCFYLLEQSGKEMRLNAYMFLLSRPEGLRQRHELYDALSFFKGRNVGASLPEPLRHHRDRNRRFVARKVKRVLVVATMSAGKSTLVNALVGRKINQVRSTACTSRIHHIYNKPAAEGAMAIFGENRLIFTEDYSLLNSEAIEAVGINFRSTLSDARICLIDTPGVNNNGDSSHGDMTRGIIRDNTYDILLLVLNARQLAINDEKNLIDFIGRHTKRKVIAVLNQCDAYRASEDSIEEAIETGRRMLHEAGIASPQVVPVSAYAAFLSRQASDPDGAMDEDDEFEYEQIAKKMRKPYYNMPAYLPGVPDDIDIPSVTERSGVPYLEYLIKSS